MREKRSQCDGRWQAAAVRSVMVSIVVCNGAAEDAASGMEPMEASSGAIWRLIGCVPLAASSPGLPDWQGLFCVMAPIELMERGMAAATWRWPVYRRWCDDGQPFVSQETGPGSGAFLPFIGRWEKAAGNFVASAVWATPAERFIRASEIKEWWGRSIALMHSLARNPPSQPTHWRMTSIRRVTAGHRPVGGAPISRSSSTRAGNQPETHDLID